MEESNVVLFLIGNGQGAAGFGFGKAPDYERALERAKVNAERDMIAIDRYEGRTIYHPLHGKHNGTQCILRPCRRGTGNRSGRASVKCYHV
jgi:ribosomal protein S5